MLTTRSCLILTVCCIEATTRSQGRPRTNLAPSEIKIPVFQLPTSHTARAKKLMLLSKHHPAIFSDLEAGKLSWKEAIGMAGLSKSSPRRCLRMGVLDLNRARALPDRGQTKLLGEMFTAMCPLTPNATCWRTWSHQ